MEGKELVLYQEMHVTTRALAAKRLRELAAKIESAAFTMGDYAVSLPSEVKLKVEFDSMEAGEGELELELHWMAWDSMPATGMAEGLD
jgi:amphi-Trp domain-containing protein